MNKPSSNTTLSRGTAEDVSRLSITSSGSNRNRPKSKLAAARSRLVVKYSVGGKVRGSVQGTTSATSFSSSARISTMGRLSLEEPMNSLGFTFEGMLHFVKQTVCLVATRKHAQIRCIKKEAQRSAPLTLRQGSDLRRRPRARFDLVWIFFLGRQQLS